MSNSLDSGTRTVSAHKAGKSVSVLDEDMLPQKNIGHFFSGDRLAYLVITVAVGVGITVFLALSRVTDINTQSELLVLSFLIAMSFLLLLLFFVGRQLLRLWRERSRRDTGSQLHLRLALLFGGITAIPAILVAMFAVSIIDYSLRGWFAERISTAVNESVEVASAYFEEHSRSVRGQILAMANDLNREASRLARNPNQFNDYISNQTALRNLSEAVIIDGTGQILAKSQFAFSLAFSGIDDELVARAREGEVVIITSKENNKLQAIMKLNSFVDAYLLAGRFIDADVIDALNRTRVAADDYQSLSLRQFDLQISLAVMFGAVALMLLLASIWVGLNLATSIAGPLVRVMTVAEQVRSGNFKGRVPESDDVDELSRLGASFNRMLDDVSSSREQLVQANRQLDARREFTEAVLGGVSSGVIGLDHQGKITLPNQAACELLEKRFDELYGHELTGIQPAFAPLFEYIDQRRRIHPELQIDMQIGRRKVILRTRVTSERVDGRLVGYVVTFDDITDFLSAQRKAAWADVARRIAHEIKNPLTPIALATDRLQKKYRPSEKGDAEKFDDYVSIISRQVNDIGRMVEEFSQFARMPAPVLKKLDARKLLTEQKILLDPNSQVSLDIKLPEDDAPVYISADAGLMRQVITNLTKNSVENMQDNNVTAPKIKLSLQATDERAEIEVRDYGSGFPGEDTSTFLEPYVTTREKGTGLGLAIAQKVISDHSGEIRLDNHPEVGAVVTLSMPLAGGEE